MPLIDASSEAADSVVATPQGTSSPSQGDPRPTQSIDDAALSNVLPWDDKIRDLRLEASRMRTERKAVMRQLKNTKQKARRLKSKAKTLSEQDMLQILKMKRTASAAETPASPRASASSGSAGNSPASSGSSEAGVASTAVAMMSIAERFDE